MMRPTRRRFLVLAIAGGVAMVTAGAGGVARAATRAAKNRGRREAKKSAAGAAAPAAPTTAGPASAKPADTRGAPGASAALPPAVRKEIENQKVSMAKTLATIRDYPLLPGSAPAFVFRPVAPRRRGSR
jgi:hypothetical protein